MKLVKKSMDWLMLKKSKFSKDDKVLIYKSVIKLMWTYGFQHMRMIAISQKENGKCAIKNPS